MTLTVNGKTMQCNDAVTVADLLAETGYKEVYVAVELNEEIVPRENFKTCILKENDVVEIVTFMGGGSQEYKKEEDTFILGGHEFTSRFILGSGKYNSHLIRAAVEYADAEIVTLALRRANTRPEENILDFIPKNVTLLPNTSGARNAEEAIRIARLARKMAGTDFVKVEIMRDSKYLLPDNQETIKATEVLANEGFVVMPYMYPDLNIARDLANAGAACIMPLASPIGSNKGLATKDFIQILIDEIDLPIIVDAGIGRPSQACEAMEMGAAAIMANTAIATAGDIPMMASAFKDAIIAGRKAYLAGPGRVLDKGGAASDPLTGFLR